MVAVQGGVRGWGQKLARSAAFTVEGSNFISLPSRTSFDNATIIGRYGLQMYVSFPGSDTFLNFSGPSLNTRMWGGHFYIYV